MPKSKRRWSVFGHIFDIFRVFLLFGRFWQSLVTFHARDDQKWQKINEKTSLTTSLATSSSPPAPHHQCITNTPSQQGLTNCSALPMVSSPTLPIEWAGGGSGSAGSIRPPIRRMSDGVLDLCLPGILPKPSLSGVRVTRRGNRLVD